MNWFEGSVKDAVKAAKIKNCFFAVYIEGHDKLSEIMTSVLNSREISTILESDKYISFKIKSDSEEYNYFVNIYKHVPIPSLFLIGLNGVPVAVVHNSSDEDKQTIHNNVLKIIKNLKEKEDILGSEASTSKIDSFIKVKEMVNSSIDEQNSISLSVPVISHNRSINEDLCISTSNAVLMKADVVSGEENHDGCSSIKEDSDEGKRTEYIEPVSKLKSKDMRNITADEGSKIETLSARLAYKQDLDEHTSHSLNNSSLKTIRKKENNSIKDVEKEDEPLFVKKKSEESIKDGSTSASGTNAENTTFQSIFSDVSEIEVEELDITEELILKDYQHGKSEGSAKEQSNQLRRTLNRQISYERKQKWKEKNRITQEKIENDLDRQRILKEIALDKEERLARQHDVECLQRSNLNQPVARPSNPEESRVHSRDHTLIQFRTPDGLAFTETFTVDSVINDLRNYVTRNIQLHNRQFNLAVAFPSHTFTAEDNNKTLEELNLVPNAVVLILPVTTDSSTMSYVCSRVSNTVWFLVSPIVSPLIYLRENVFRPISGSLRTSFRIPLTTILLPQFNENSIHPSEEANSQLSGNLQNLHMLADHNNNNDDDDENNTWNGNSTQQLQ